LWFDCACHFEKCAFNLTKAGDLSKSSPAVV